MNTPLFQHVVKVIEGHFGKPFGTDETRAKALNHVWANVRHLPDADLDTAADRLILNNRALPTPAEFQATILSVAEARQRSQTAAIEAESKQNNRQDFDWQKQPSVDRMMMRDGIDLLTQWQQGAITRDQLYAGYDRLHATYPKAGWNVAKHMLIDNWQHKTGNSYCLQGGLI